MSKEELLEKRTFELTVGEFVRAIINELKEEEYVNIINKRLEGLKDDRIS